MEKFGTRLRGLRNSAHLTQDALAEQLGITQSQVSKLESGKADVTAELVDAICGAVGLVGRWGLVGGTEVEHLDHGPALVSVSGRPGISHLAYFASALTGLSQAERDAVFAEAERVRTICDPFRVFLYEPRLYTDPVKNAGLSADDVYATDRAQVSESDVMILSCRHPSFGAGQEIEIASAAGIPIIALVPNGTVVSRMVLGCYAPFRVVVSSDAHVLEVELRQALEWAMNANVARKTSLSNSGLGSRIKRRRTDRHLTTETVATLAGTTANAIAQLETGDCRHQNPSVSLLRRVAAALETTVSFLVEGVSPLPEQSDPILAKSRATFQVFARQIPFADATKLWTDYVDSYETDRRVVAEARSEPLTEEDWAARVSSEDQAESGSLFGEE